jgi:cytidine deaminase
MIDWGVLIDAAREARDNAYAKFSGFEVGAAILTGGGKIITGCNVENSSFGLTMCAERTAVFKAVSEGEKDFVAIAVFSQSTPPARPCGACRQVLHEFNPDLEIVCANSQGVVDRFFLSQLLPEGFRLR